MVNVIGMKLARRSIRVSSFPPASRRLCRRVALESAVTVLSGPEPGDQQRSTRLLPQSSGFPSSALTRPWRQVEKSARHAGTRNMAIRNTRPPLSSLLPRCSPPVKAPLPVQRDAHCFWITVLRQQTAHRTGNTITETGGPSSPITPLWCVIPGAFRSGFFSRLLYLQTQGLRVSKPRLALFDGDEKLHVAAKGEENNSYSRPVAWEDAGGCVGLTPTGRSRP